MICVSVYFHTTLSAIDTQQHLSTSRVIFPLAKYLNIRSPHLAKVKYIGQCPRYIELLFVFCLRPECVYFTIRC